MEALKDFGIELSWKYEFLGPGTTVNPLPNTLFVDLGNRLTEGIIDTHHSDDYKSSAHALKERPDLVLNHLLTNLNEAYARGEQDRLNNLDEMEFTFVTHEDPDWDGIATFYLCNHLLINGSLPDSWLTDLLVAATNQIDQGKAQMKGKTKRPFLILYDIMGDENIRSKEQLKKGVALIEAIIAKIEEGEFCDCPPGNPFLEHFDNLEKILPDYAGHLKRLEMDRVKYEQDVKEKAAPPFEIDLPLKKIPKGKGKTFKSNCKAIAFNTPPSCTLHKYWVRDEGKHQLLLIPYYKEGTTDIKGWIISVDPTGNYDLKRLGYLLEKEEKSRREEMGDIDDRPGPPRWDDEKYSENSDPWYDGRNFEHTIVDSPRSGTELKLEDIKRVIKQRFHGIQLEESPNNNLAFYFFFEIPENNGEENGTRESLKDFLGKAKLSETPVLQNLDKAFQFIKEIKLWSKECPLDGNDVFNATLWASEITRHCVLQLQVKDFQKTVASHAQTPQTPVILEDLTEVAEGIEKQAGEIAEKIRVNLKLEKRIWGLECFRLLELNQPDLRFHSKEKVRNVFDTLLRDKLPKEQIDRLIEGEGTEQIRTSHALCILNKARHDGDEEEPSQRQIMLFYSLFLKTGYRNFSERIGEIVNVIINPESREYENDIKEIQEDYSAFLGRYEFSEREINTDDGLQNFFKSALKAMGFQEQRDETRHEMQTTFELAAAKNRKAIERGNIILNCLILGLGILALGDFAYAWWTGQNEENIIGFYVVGSLASIAVVAVVLLNSKLIKQRVSEFWKKIKRRLSELVSSIFS